MNRFASAFGALIFAVVAVMAGACGSASKPEAAPAAACADVKVDRFKELMIVDPAVIDDVRAKNKGSGAWSFRHAIEQMTAPGTDPSEFVRAWLLNWVDTREVNGFQLDRPGELRDAEMHHRIICPWLKRTPANACDETCGSCAGTKLDLDLAPFRLIGIANRLDQREQVADEPSGEGRLVFNVTNGAADDPNATPLPMTIVFEYFLLEHRTTRQWADAWHALGQFPSYDEPYRAALQGVTDLFIKRGAESDRVNGSALAQIRTNESTLNWIWQLREFALDTDGQLRLRPVRNTPGAPLNNSTVLRDYVVANADAIKARRFEMPLTFRGGSADQLLFTWSLPNVEESTRKAFAKETCNGCHSGENPSVDTVFHISPFRQGLQRLSPFLNDPSGKPDELTYRTTSLQKALCTP